MSRFLCSLLLLANFIFDPNLSIASTGRFDCIVKKIDITSFDEGQVKTYVGWSNLGVNDKLVLEYREPLLDGVGIMLISDLFMAVSQIISSDQLIEWDDGSIMIKSYPLGPATQIWFSEDYISAYSDNDGKTALAMRRYHKNDWDVSIIKQSHDDRMLESSNVALSCRHKNDRIKQIIAEIRKHVSGAN